MSCTILPKPGVLRLAAALLATAALPARAHEIPSRVTVLAFVAPEQAEGRLRIVLRVPLEAMRDVTFPERSLGYLDLERARPLALEAAQLWIASHVTAYENGAALGDARITATRISLPADRAFTSYASALASTLGPPLDPATEIPWNQTVLDVVLDYRVASAASSFAIEPRLAHLGVRTTTVLHFVAPSGAVRSYQYVGDPGRVQLDPRWFHAAWRFVTLGIEHILGGLDHLLFVLCLVIPFRRMRPLILLVTAFTVAHSITLAAAALGVVPDALWFPPLVETLIATSILYMAIENILGARLQRRWLIAFAFGLVHGFGFSFALGESLQFAGSHLATALLAFNVGVELGQLGVLALAVPLLSWLLKRVPERAGVIVLSAFVAHTAWHWTTERAASLREYQFTLPPFDAALALSATRALLVVLIAVAAAWGMAEVHRRLFGRPAGGNAPETAPERS